MPGTNAGTGYPFTFRCSKCKAGREFRMEAAGYDHDCGMNIEVTGRTRRLTRSQQGRGNPRALNYRVEYRCKDCGHTGWSRHKGMLRYARSQGIELSAP